MTTLQHSDEQDGDAVSHKLNEDVKGSKKKKKTSTASASRNTSKTGSKSSSTAAKASMSTSSDTSPSHLKPSVITPPPNKAPSPSSLKTASSNHDRLGGKSPLASKHTNAGSSAIPPIHDSLSDHAITKRRSEEEISSTRYKIPKRSELSKNSISRSDSEGMENTQAQPVCMNMT
jgi:hypothetical protein